MHGSVATSKKEKKASQLQESVLFKEEVEH
jgi:hypothetical protein